MDCVEVTETSSSQEELSNYAAIPFAVPISDMPRVTRCPLHHIPETGGSIHIADDHHEHCRVLQWVPACARASLGTAKPLLRLRFAVEHG